MSQERPKFEFGCGTFGEQYDASSDLTFLRSRYYSPGTASFLSRDTLQPNAGGVTGYNPYAYANRNPTTFTDPSGHFTMGDIIDWVGGGTGAIFAYMAAVLECFSTGNCRYHSQWGEQKYELLWAKQLACTASSLTSSFSTGAVSRLELRIQRNGCPTSTGLKEIHLPDWWGACDKYLTGLGCSFPEDCTSIPYVELREVGQSDRRALVDAIMVMKLPRFKCIKNRTPFTDLGINWHDDNCSYVPDNPNFIPFETACERHDFGYRNYKRVLNLEFGSDITSQQFLQSSERDFVDANFKGDMDWTCNNVLTLFGKSLSDCLDIAAAYHVGVTSLQDFLFD